MSSTLTVSAPFDGILLEQMAIPGQKLEPADPLFKIGHLSPLWLEVHIPVDAVSRVAIGDVVSVPELVIEGEIITIGRMVHAADQGTLVRAIVHSRTEQLRPGQVVQARIVKKSDGQQRYLVPRKAIVRINQETMIFTASEQGFKAIRIEIAGNQEGQQVVTSDQPITDPIVIHGAVTLKAIMTGAGGEG